MSIDCIYSFMDDVVAADLLDSADNSLHIQLRPPELKIKPA
jgi:hypothetical protein